MIDVNKMMMMNGGVTWCGCWVAPQKAPWSLGQCVLGLWLLWWGWFSCVVLVAAGYSDTTTSSGSKTAWDEVRELSKQTISKTIWIFTKL